MKRTESDRLLSWAEWYWSRSGGGNTFCEAHDRLSWALLFEWAGMYDED